MSNVPKLRFKEFSGEWEEKKLGEITEITMGQSPSSNSYNSDNNGIPLIQGNADIQNRLSNPRNYTTEKTKECRVGDLILTVRAPVGSVAKSIHNACIGRGVCAIKNNKGSINEFIYQFLLNYETKWSSLEQGSTFTAVSGLEIKKLKLNIPSKQEQEKIASFLTTIDIKIEQLTKKEELLQQYKKGVMQKIFNQKIRFKADDGSEFCEWEEKNLSSLCNIKKGSQLNKDTLTEVGIYPAINGGVNPSGYTTKYNTEENTITISEGGNSCGYVNFIKTNFWSGGHNYSLQKVRKEVNNTYLYQSLKFYENLIMRLRVGSGLPNIQKGDISNFKINLPCLEEQEKIAKFLSSIDKKIEVTKIELEKTKEFKKALLQQMFV